MPEQKVEPNSDDIDSAYENWPGYVLHRDEERWGPMKQTFEAGYRTGFAAASHVPTPAPPPSVKFPDESVIREAMRPCAPPPAESAPEPEFLWTFDLEDNMELEYRGFQVGSLRDQWDTEQPETEEGEEFDAEMRRLGIAIANALNAAQVRYPEYDKTALPAPPVSKQEGE